MSKRPSLRASVSAPSDEADQAAANVRKLQRRQEEPKDRPMTTSTIHLPLDLLDTLRHAATRRASRRAHADDKGRGGRPSVSEIVVELLERHRDELDA